MVTFKVFAGRGCETFFTLAKALFYLLLTGYLTEICSRSSDIVDIALKMRILGQQFDLIKNRLLTSCCDLTALVVSD